MNIWLVGHMGSGKSTVGSLLATELGLDFVDTDEMIESMLNLQIRHIFLKHGEKYFRSLERQLCLQIAQSTNQVIATGGGIPAISFSLSEMKRSGTVFHLDTNTDILWSRVETAKSLRPLARSKEQFIELYKSRQQFYQDADYSIQSSGDANDVRDEIMRHLDSST